MNPSNSLSQTASWIIRDKETGQVLFETFSKNVASAINNKNYEAVPILKYLQELNSTINDKKGE